VNDGEDDENKDPRKWLKVIDAYEQPRLVYNVGKKHFDRLAARFESLLQILIWLQRHVQTFVITLAIP
jgi:DNA polymerase epsilon subunit 2